MEVTDVDFQDNHPAEGLPVFDDGMITPKRWVTLSSIESALCLSYPFGDHYNFNKSMLSKSLGKLHPKIDSLQDPNGLGVYRCKMSGGYFFSSKI
jgi:hypothetical protein